MIETVDEHLDELGFDPELSVLTRRQAQVMALRERGVEQADIAEAIGSSRANVSSIESSARANVEKARETVELAEALSAPVRLVVPAETNIYEVPELVYDACDDAGVKLDHTAPDLLKLIGDSAGAIVSGRMVTTALTISVTADGLVRVRSA